MPVWKSLHASLRRLPKTQTFSSLAYFELLHFVDIWKIFPAAAKFSQFSLNNWMNKGWISTKQLKFKFFAQPRKIKLTCGSEKKLKPMILIRILKWSSSLVWKNTFQESPSRIFGNTTHEQLTFLPELNRNFIQGFENKLQNKNYPQDKQPIQIPRSKSRAIKLHWTQHFIRNNSGVVSFRFRAYYELF